MSVSRDELKAALREMVADGELSMQVWTTHKGWDEYGVEVSICLGGDVLMSASDTFTINK